MKIIPKIIMAGALGLGLTINGLAQTNLQFTSVSRTDEGAIQLHWASQSNHVYEIDEADSLIDTNTGSTTWNDLYDEYPSQGTNTFIGDFGNYNVTPQIPHPKNSPVRFYRILDEGQDGLASDEPTVLVSSPTNSALGFGELIITVTAFTDQPLLAGTKLYVDGQEMQMADSTTNWTDGSTNYETDNLTNQLCGRGVFLSRTLDGILFFSMGEDALVDGFWIEFGSHGQIRGFSLVWPALKRDKLQPAASPQQIIACIRAFKTMTPPIGKETHYFARIKNLAKAKKLTITKITPYYMEGIYGQTPTNDEPPKVIAPLAELEAVADFGNSNMPVRLLSPVLSSEVGRLLTEKSRSR
ncbi:MAG: hypothetical protein ACREDS_11210 [Limisphaerales bacterium]